MKYLSGLIVILFLESCAQECTTDIHCGRDLNTINMHGYSYAELDTISLRWYKPGSNFSQKTGEQQYILDSTAKPTSLSSYYAVSNDISKPTDSIRLCGLFYLRQVPDGNTADDVEIFIPVSNRTYRLSDIMLDGNYKNVLSHPCNKVPFSTSCYRSIVSHKIDGVAVNTEMPNLYK
ncbi:MAG: hypothetical protein K0R82_1478 [Flavipsychrobacter sp.]|jgi:hypothetical protein|nr:hypothetical protein [Flavipsychrobacter sp.]